MIDGTVKVLLIEETAGDIDQLVKNYESDLLWGRVEVLHVRSLSMAMSYLETTTPDVVVTDIDDTAVVHVRALTDEREIPLVVLSPEESDGAYTAGGRLGRAVRYALKCRRGEMQNGINKGEPTGVTKAYESMRVSLAETKQAASGVTHVGADLRSALERQNQRKVRSKLTPPPFAAAKPSENER